MKLHVLALAAASSLALAPPVLAKPASASAQVLAVIHRFIDSFNKGDVKTAEATHAADAVIIDEVPPHVWKAPGAFKAWAGDLEAAGKAAGDTDEKVTLGRPVRVQVDGDTAYVVIKATFTYTEKGRAMAEPAQMTYALKKDGGAWKIAGWAWTGSVPHAAPAAPAAAPAKP